MTTFNLESLGFTKDQIAERIIDAAVDRLLGTPGDEDTDQHSFSSKMREAIRARVNETIDRLATEHVLPRVSDMVENICIQETTKWGEKRGEPKTFVESLTERAEAYLAEKADYQGKSKEEGSYSWSGMQTRITALVHQHLHFSIETAMKAALASVTSSIAKGIQETVKLKLAEAAAAMKVEVKTK